MVLGKIIKFAVAIQGIGNVIAGLVLLGVGSGMADVDSLFGADIQTSGTGFIILGFGLLIFGGLILKGVSQLHEE